MEQKTAEHPIEQATKIRSAKIERIESHAYKIPTQSPESDGTLQWDSTTMVTVFIQAAGERGFGYTYADASVTQLIRGILARAILGMDPFSIASCWEAMINAVRNNGQSGLSMMAISAIDNALWDLKAKLLKIPLMTLLGQAREKIPVYGSGGFTSYSLPELQAQLTGWISEGVKMVKMKVGRDHEADQARVAAAREAIGDGPDLFVDANGGYGRKEALYMAAHFAEQGVTWFEEPVNHRDLPGLRLIRDRVPAGMEISVGEYGFELSYFERILESQAADVLQADATRCGITGFLQVAALCEANHLPLSSHCAPSLHLSLDCALSPVRHLEYFYDHVRIEKNLFDGAISPVDGFLSPDLSRPGLGIELKMDDAKKYEV